MIRKGRASFVTGCLVLFVLGLIFILGVYGRTRAPEQPIAFSHKVHAGEYKIACEYCHTYARRSSVAGVPSVERCMGCHKLTARDKSEVKKLLGYWDQKKPIPWVKVFYQPDFVYFSHRPHVSKEIACQVCHGPVEQMDKLEEAVVLNMRRCVDCHMERKASIDCWACHK